MTGKALLTAPFTTKHNSLIRRIIYVNVGLCVRKRVCIYIYIYIYIYVCVCVCVCVCIYIYIKRPLSIQILNSTYKGHDLVIIILNCFQGQELSLRS